MNTKQEYTALKGTMKKKLLCVLAFPAGLAIMVFAAYIGWREHARTKFSGCNLAHREAARLEVESLALELNCARTDTDDMSVDRQTLSQKLSRAQADFQKWDRHVRRYGHLCGTGTDEARDVSQRNTCINNLRMIDSAKESTALAHSYQDGQTVREEEIADYLKDGFSGLSCPKGGRYTINPVGKDPECSIHGALSAAKQRR